MVPPYLDPNDNGTRNVLVYLSVYCRCRASVSTRFKTSVWDERRDMKLCTFRFLVTSGFIFAFEIMLWFINDYQKRNLKFVITAKISRIMRQSWNEVRITTLSYHIYHTRLKRTVSLFCCYLHILMKINTYRILYNALLNFFFTLV